jgi:hypothetical protein
MNLDKFIEVFVSSLILIITGVVAIYIWSPNIGETLINILPDVVTIMVYLFIPLFLILMVYEMLDSV